EGVPDDGVAVENARHGSLRVGAVGRSGRRARADRPIAVVSSALRVLARSSPVGSSLALWFWMQSLTPTLIPRPWESQAVIGAVCLAVGYAIGAFAGLCMSRIAARPRVVPAESIRRLSRLLLGTAWPAGVVLGSARWQSWQNEQRDFMGMASIVPSDAVMMGALSPLFGVILLVVGSGMMCGARASVRFIRRLVPRSGAAS